MRAEPNNSFERTACTVAAHLDVVVLLLAAYNLTSWVLHPKTILTKGLRASATLKIANRCHRPDTESFSKFMLEATTFIAEENSLILGFGGITRLGHVTSLYVRGDYNRQGIGSKLLTEILEYARIHQCTRIYGEASEFSKPLFEKFGFETYGEEEVEKNGILFHRYLMQRCSL